MGKFNKFNNERKGRDFGFDRGFGGQNGGHKFGKRPNFTARDGGAKEMFPAVCSTCGNDCEVPFKPTGKFPVYCKNCFKKQGGDNARSAGFSRFSTPKPFSDRNQDRKFNTTATPSFTAAPVSTVSKAQFEALSAKVDRILDLLIAIEGKEPTKKKAPIFSDDEEVVEFEPKTVKKTTAKAVVAKKTKSKKK